MTLNMRALRSALIVPAFGLALGLGTGCASTQDTKTVELKTADNDGDGIPNGIDSCPNEAGKPENYGCDKPQLVEVTKSKLIIHNKIYFATDSDAIEERSNDLLNAIAKVLKSHEEIKHIRVEGHTDNTGDPAYNVDLSQRRAASVVTYLNNQGLVGDRLVAKGVGAAEPISENETDEGRAKNRRVEFVFFSDDEAAAEADAASDAKAAEEVESATEEAPAADAPASEG